MLPLSPAAPLAPAFAQLSLSTATLLTCHPLPFPLSPAGMRNPMDGVVVKQSLAEADNSGGCNDGEWLGGWRPT